MTNRSTPLNPKAWAASLGLILSLDYFLHSAIPAMGFTVLWWNAEALTTLQKFYSGISATLLGAILAIIWGLLTGALFGYLFAITHNWFLKN